MKLYFFPPSNNSRRAHAVALHLNLFDDSQLIDLQAGDQRTREFLALNPAGRVPVLQDGDFVLWESNAIIQYLASQKETSLWPNDAKSRAQIMGWQSWQMCHWSRGTQPLQFERFVKQILNMGEPDETAIAQASKTFHKEASLLNNHLETREYLVNNTLTLADFSVASDLTYANIAQFPLEPYAHIRSWYARIEALPAWQQTTPKQ